MTGKRSTPKGASGISLLGDIGGTHARFALLAKGRIGKTAILNAADYAGPYPAMRAFLDARAPGVTIEDACLAVAGWVEKGRATLTNGGWAFDTAEIRRKFKCRSANLINDFEAIAWSLARLRGKDLYRIGAPKKPMPGHPLAAIGPGTGLGVGCLLPEGSSWRALAGEGGHVSLPADDKREAEVVEWLRARFGHVSAERALAGHGLVNLYHAIAAIEGRKAPELGAPEIADAAIAGSSSLAVAALDMFCSFLGGVAGNLALTYGARGGVFIAGGMVPHFPAYLNRSAFRQRFEAKGRLSSFLEPIPTAVILHPNPAMLGLAAFLSHHQT